MVEHKGVMILAEVREGKPAAITAELLGCGRRLADDLGEELSAVLVGDRAGVLAGEVIAAGADKVYTVEEALLVDYQPDAITLYTAYNDATANDALASALADTLMPMLAKRFSLSGGE